MAAFWKVAALETPAPSASPSASPSGTSIYTPPGYSLTPPIKLVLSGPVGLISQACSSAYTVTATDMDSTPRFATSAITVNLTGKGNGTFYSSPDCTGAITSVTIGAGQSDTKFYFKDNSAEALTFSAADASASLSTGTLGVTVYASGLVITGPVTHNVSGPCAIYTVTNVNGLGAAVAFTGTVTMSGAAGGSSGSNFFGSTACSGSKSSSLNLSFSNVSSMTFGFKPTTVGPELLIFTASATTALAGTLAVATNGAAPSKLVFVGSTSIYVSACTPYTIKVQDASGNPSGVSADTTVTLSGGGSGFYYASSNCTGQTITSATIPSGSNQVTYYYMDTTPQTVTMGAAATGLTSASISVLVTTPRPNPMIALSDYWHHACALLTDGGLKCWGFNSYGQLGDGTTTARSTPVSAFPNLRVIKVDLGQEHSMALRSDGTIVFWGRNTTGQFGDGTSNTPAPGSFTTVVGITNAVDIATGSGHSCAVLADKTVKCWGANANGQLGNNSTTASSSPVTVSGINNALQVTLGGTHTCAALDDGTAKCWGSQSDGQLGNGVTGTANQLTPVAVTGLAGVKQIAAIGNSTCAVLATGELKCWGDNASGQLGDGTIADHNTPAPVSGITNATQVSMGRGEHACAVLSDKSMKCWGYNVEGELGNNTTTDSKVPVVVQAPSNAAYIAAGYDFTCALFADGTVRCWGWDYMGKLGDGGSVSRSVPYPVTGLNVLVP